MTLDDLLDALSIGSFSGWRMLLGVVLLLGGFALVVLTSTGSVPVPGFLGWPGGLLLIGGGIWMILLHVQNSED